MEREKLKVYTLFRPMAAHSEILYSRTKLGRLVRYAQLCSFRPRNPHDGFQINLLDVKTSKAEAVGSPRDLFLPRCSPDGRFIVAATHDGQSLKLFEFSTGNWSDLVTHAIGFPRWSSDSKYVYFDTGANKELAVYRLRIADRNLERVADLQSLRRVVEPWVSWMGLTPDGAPLFMRDIGRKKFMPWTSRHLKSGSNPAVNILYQTSVVDVTSAGSISEIEMLRQSV